MNDAIIAGFAIVDQALQQGYTKNTWERLCERQLTTQEANQMKTSRELWNKFVDEFMDLMSKKWDSYFKDEMEALE